MSAIGSLVFCRDCGNLLDRSSDQENTLLTCAVCGAQGKDTSSQMVVTTSKPSAFPSALRSKRSAVQTLTAADTQTEATIQKTCPQCGRDEMRFTTLQLRGADEGTTVFFTCECGYKFTENN